MSLSDVFHDDQRLVCSDYMSFVNAGIGAGGLTTGSDQVKTPEQVALFGGTAGQIMHPCYHTACDRLDTVNVPFLDDPVGCVRARDPDLRADAGTNRASEGRCEPSPLATIFVP